MSGNGDLVSRARLLWALDWLYAGATPPRYGDVRAMIETAPAHIGEGVTRCNDCLFAEMDTNGRMTCELTGLDVHTDDYCARACTP